VAAPLLIRSAHTDDLDALVRIDAIAERASARVARLRAAIDRGECFVAERAGCVVGYGVLEHSFFENGFLGLLLVRDEDRRSGIGSALEREAERRCRSEKLFTSTNASNLPMQRLLARLGFSRCGTIDELDPGDSEWVYVRYLGSESSAPPAGRAHPR